MENRNVPDQWIVEAPVNDEPAKIVFAGSQRRLSSGDISDDRIPVGGTPGWVILNLYMQYSWNFLDLTGSFQNISDQLYKTHGSGLYGPGRGFWLSVSFDIRN